MNNMIETINEIVTYITKNNVKNTCDDISKFVSYVCYCEGFDCKLVVGEYKNHVDGEYHAWNKINDEIIDCTVQQFQTYQNGIISKIFYEENYEMIEEETIDWEKETIIKGTLLDKCITEYMKRKR